MRQLSVHLDMKHVGSLESTQAAMYLLYSPNFPRASYLDERTLTHEPIVKCIEMSSLSLEVVITQNDCLMTYCPGIQSMEIDDRKTNRSIDINR